MRSSLSIALLLSGFVYSVALTGIRNHWSDPYSLRPNPLYPYARSPAIRSPKNSSTSTPRFSKSSNVSPSRTWSSKFRAGALQPRQDASSTTEQDLDTRPTPEPTGEPSIETTIFITDENDFALLLPATSGGMFEFRVILVTVFDHDQTIIITELVSDAENNAKAFCTPGSPGYPCKNMMPDGFITAAALASANDNSWIQVTFASVPSAGLSGLQYILHRSLVVSIRQSFTWILAIPEANLTCASRTGPSVPSAGEGQVLLSCALFLGFYPFDITVC
jgi:hypothetical protein